MSQNHPWVGLLSAGFVTTLAGQIAFNLFAEGIDGTPLIPVGQNLLVLLAALLTGLGTAWVSRSSFGLLHSDRPVTQRAQFWSEALFTALMVLLSNMCGWLGLEVIRLVSDPSEEGRLLSIPLLIAVSAGSLIALLSLTAYARYTPGTPLPWLEKFKNAVRGFRPWRWIARPREDWKPTKLCTAVMYTLFYAGLSARVAAGITAGTTLTLIVQASENDEPTTAAQFSGFGAALIFMGLGATIARLPEKLLPERTISRGRRTAEELVSVAVGSFAILVITALAESIGFDPLKIIILGTFAIAPITFLWGIVTDTQRSIDKWREPVREARGARGRARKDLKRLNQTYEDLDTSGSGAAMRQKLVAEAITSAKEAETTASNALEAAIGKR